MSDSRRRTMFWVVADKASRLIAGAFVTSAVARYLGPTEFGSLSVAAGLVAIAVATAGLGAQHIELSELSKRSESDGATFLYSAFFIKCLWALFCFSALLFSVLIFDLSGEYLLLILSIGILVTPFAVIGAQIQASGSFALFSILSFSSNVLGALFRVGCIVASVSTPYFAIAYVAESCLLPLFLAIWFCRYRAKLANPISFSMSEASSYFRLCIPTAISITLIVIYFRIELFLIDHLIDKNAAGIWAASLMFLMPWGIVASSIVPFANRRLALIQDDEKQYRLQIVKLLRQMYGLACLAILLNILAVHLFVPLLLGDMYAPVAGIVTIASFSLVAIFSGTVQELWIAHNRKTGTVLKKILISLPLSAGMYFLLIPNYGLLGAAYAMVVSHFVTTLLLNMMLDSQFFKIQLYSFGLARAL